MTDHSWVPSTLGHGNRMCVHCKATDLEAAAIGLIECHMAPREERPVQLVAEDAHRWTLSDRLGVRVCADCGLTVGEVHSIKVETCSMQPRDTVIDAVRDDLLRRSQFGIKKYGVTLDRKDLNLRDWLNHAYEEALDHANYLKRAMMEIDNAAGSDRDDRR